MNFGSPPVTRRERTRNNNRVPTVVTRVFSISLSFLVWKMPRKPRENKKPRIPEIAWAENDNHLIWLLLAEIEKDANYRVLFGKKDKDEVTAPVPGQLLSLN